MNTNLYSILNNCTEWRIYKDVDTARNNISEKYFSLGLRNSNFLVCFGGTRKCTRCCFFSDSDCIIKSNVDYLMDSIKQLTDGNYISITPKSYPELFI